MASHQGSEESLSSSSSSVSSVHTPPEVVDSNDSLVSSSYADHDEESNELHININGESLPLKDFLAEDRAITAPHYEPIEVVVSHVTCTVRVPPPQKKQKTVATELNCLAKAREKKESLDLLHDVSFYLKPGEMTLLLGAPGCGKSTLLKLLAGTLKQGKKKGEVLFNGRNPKDGHYNRSISFVPQQDTHIAQLTVKETLRFSAECQMSSSLQSSDKARRVDAMLQILGLSHRANTVVGDALLRGVSGGEKKRVTIGVEAIKDSAIFLMDEPTTGLDSSAAYDVLHSVRLLADMKATVLASLLQPSYEVFSLFDNLLILTGGRVAFFGRRQEALDHFESLGYRCSRDINPAEFLQEVVESGTGLPNRNKYRAGDEDDTDNNDDYGGGEDQSHWLSPSEFVDAYEKSSYYENTLKEIEQMKHAYSKVSNDDGHNEPQYATSTLYQFYLLTKRAFTREWRDMVTNRSRIISALFLSIVLGLLFLQLDNHQSDARTKLGLVFTIMAYFSFASLNALPGVIADRAVYYYQQDAKYYRSLPYLLANLLAEVPMTAIETLIYCCITYWMTGLNSDGDRFIYFVLICGAYYFMTRSFNRFVACFSADLTAAQGISPVLTALSILFGGYIITRSAIPGWWIAAYWVNPAIYGFQGLVANEFWDTSYKCKSDELVPRPDDPLFNVSYPLGYSGNQVCPMTSGTEYAIKEFDVWDYSWLKWVFLAVVICYWFIFNVLSWLALCFVRHEPAPAARMQESEMSNDGLEISIQEIKKAAIEKKNKKRNQSTEETVEGAYLSWHNLNYSVTVREKLKKKELQLLHEVSGYVKPGMLLALMGASGAGKSTLLDVLARRKTGGKITGDILLNGRKTGSQLNRAIGYVEQQDIHNPSQTVLEALEFSAICRLPQSVPRELKKQYAKSLLSVLDLEKQAHMVIGNNAQDGISADQRKRVTIGVEMAADPAILFLDEPTSGLDSFGAERVMRAVQNIAARGTPVICTIHQPSATVFGLFTHLLLLKKGGYTTYFGPIGERPGDCSVMLEYFADTLGKEIKPYQNPAEFILEVTGSGIANAQKLAQSEAVEMKAEKQVDAAAAYRASKIFGETENELEKGIYPISFEQTDSSGRMRKKWKQIKQKMKDRYATPFHVQLKELFVRSALQYWRTPPDFMGKIMAPLILGLIMGTLFLQIDDNQEGATHRAAAVYFSLIICNLVSFTLLPRVIIDRAVFYRENASRTYNSMAYAITMVVVEWPFCLVAATVYLIPFYWIAGFQADAGKFFIFWAVLVLNYLATFALVQLLCLLAPNMVLANSFCAVAYTMFAIFSGFLITRDNIPDYLIWMHYLDVNMYPLEIIIASEMDGLSLHCSSTEFVEVPINGTDQTKLYCPMTSGQDFLNSVDFDTDNMLRDGLVFLGFYLAFLAIIAFLVKFVRHQKR